LHYNLSREFSISVIAVYNNDQPWLDLQAIEWDNCPRSVLRSVLPLAVKAGLGFISCVSRPPFDVAQRRVSR
jgi:hypothetical protein